MSLTRTMLATRRAAAHLTSGSRRFTAQSTEPRIKSAVHKNHILTVTWTDDRKARFHDLWLRDSCRSGFDDGTSQRLHDSYKLQRDTRAAHVRASDDSVSIEWTGSGGALSSTPPAYSISDAALKEKEKDEEPEDRSSSPVSVYPSSWLREHAYELRSQRRVQPITWGSELPSYFATPDSPRGGIRVFDYASFLNPGSDEFQEWLVHLRDYGLAVLGGVPQEEGGVEEVARRISYVRRTHYGETFHVKSQEDPSHMAYTPVGLQFHTDLNYRESSPGVQLLHCLESAAEGGESTFVDGFHIAQQLRQADPHTFDLLTRVPVPFQLRGERGHLYHKTPTICVDDEGNLVKVHFNDRTRAPLEAPAEYVSACYDALAKFNDVVNDASNHVEFTLQPGQLVAFNNRRILHGRRPFAATASVRRHLEGAYVEFDEFLSCLRGMHISRPAYSPITLPAPWV